MILGFCFTFVIIFNEWVSWHAFENTDLDRNKAKTCYLLTCVIIFIQISWII